MSFLYDDVLSRIFHFCYKPNLNLRLVNRKFKRLYEKNFSVWRIEGTLHSTLSNNTRNSLNIRIITDEMPSLKNMISRLEREFKFMRTFSPKFSWILIHPCAFKLRDNRWLVKMNSSNDPIKITDMLW